MREKQMDIDGKVFSLRNHAASTEGAALRTKQAREFARRMIADGLMPLETVSRLTGISMTMVHQLAAEVTRKSKRR